MGDGRDVVRSLVGNVTQNSPLVTKSGSNIITVVLKCKGPNLKIWRIFVPIAVKINLSGLVALFLAILHE